MFALCIFMISFHTSGENARTIKHKVQDVIEELLFQEVTLKKANMQSQPSSLALPG
jgi:hypothetical protein